MSFIIGIEIFPPATAKLRKKPYEVKWNVNGASREQLLAASALAQVLSNKLREAAQIRFPEGDENGFSETWDRRGDPHRDSGSESGEDGPEGVVG